MKPVKAVNKDHTTAVAIIVGVALGLAVYFGAGLGIWPFTVIYAWFYGIIKYCLANIGVWLTQIQKYIEANPVPSLVGILSIGGGIYGIASKISSDRARVAAQNLAQQQLSDAQQQILELSQKHATAQSNVVDLQGQLDAINQAGTGDLAAARQLLDAKETQVSDLLAQVDKGKNTIAELENIITDLKTKTQVVIH